MKLEDIKKAVLENPSLTKDLAVWITAETDGGKELMQDFAKVERQDAINERTQEIYTGIDEDIFTALGVRKKNDERTIDFLKTIASDYKALQDKKDSLDANEEVKALKVKLKTLQDSGEINDHWRTMYDKAVADAKVVTDELEKKIADKEEEFISVQVEADLMGSFSAFELDENLPQNVIDAIKSVERTKAIKGAKIIEGKVVYHGEDGKPLLNKEHKTKTSKEIWEEALGSLIKKGDNQSQRGGGANPEIKDGVVKREKGKGDSADILTVSLDKDSFSTRVEFNNLVTKALRKEGIEAGTKEFNDAMLQTYKEYDVDKLDLE